MATIKPYPELFAVCTMIRNAVQPVEPRGFYNAWLTSTFGKIGVLQQGAYIPEDFRAKFDDPAVSSFKALVRVVHELKPGERGGMLILHPISVLSKANFRVIGNSGFQSNYERGGIVLTLLDVDLRKTMLWMAESTAKRELLQTLGGHSIICDSSQRARSLADEHPQVRYAMEKSDTLMYLASEALN